MFDNPAPVSEVDKAFESLKTFDAGSSRGALMPLDNAVIASIGDAAARKELEHRLLAALQTVGSVPAREYICGKLHLIGQAESVPALAALLADKNLACAAVNALLGISCPEMGKAVREKLPTLSGLCKVQAINLLGQRRDAQDVPVLIGVLGDQDPQTVEAAIAALGNIGTPEAAKAIQDVLPKMPPTARPAVADALLTCAERLASGGKKPEALAIYALLSDAQYPNHVRAAAQRGTALAKQ